MEKQELRERVWTTLEAQGVNRFPYPPEGRITNFAGARDAAERLADTDEWRAAQTVKANPDAPQLPVRRRALRDGKTVYMAVPRLRDERPFLKLDPAEIDDVDAATTISGSAKYGVPVAPDEVPRVDFIVAGSVAVTESGARVGKGEGYSDLEFAVLRELGAVDDETTVATTVHELQVVDDAEVTPDAHDVPLDLVVTPERAVRTETACDRPAGVDWDALDAEKLAEIPVLQHLHPN
ncbi:5-formyltetrahydrofolate cyclo-ligase [Haloprofundus salilacus]|uniref:5-formyltetrahydrofolate cyclo-ligase n=1 Tax=Haloprofundus salilacus TaxID=2876190 RepID=UPI001CCE6994|nr:5-formyltetrahydrofolate cyclo-ligase [Haloprofundus salilacus]